MSVETRDDPVTVINSAFESLLDEIKEHVLPKFGKLSSHISQFHFVNGEASISMVIDQWLEKQVLSNSDVKNEEFGISSRLRGCASIRQKRYAESVPNLNRSLRYSIYGSDNFILAKENRSEVLYNLDEFEHCIEDCDYVLKNLEGVEPDIVARFAAVMLRKMKCFVHLKSYVNAIKVHQAASEMPTKPLQYQKDEWKKELKAAKLGRAAPPENKTEDFSNALPPLVGGESILLPSASAHLILHPVTNTNRKVVTTKDLKVGDVLFVEEPFALMLMHHDTLFTTIEFCSRCCKRVKHIEPCTDCPIDVYCSTSCQKSAWESYHKWECKVGDIFSKLGPASLAFRMTCLSYNNSLNRQQLKRANELYYETKNMNAEMYFMYSVLTAMLVRYLDKHTDFIEEVGNKNTMRVAENIFQSLLQVIFNGQLITKSANIDKPGVESLMDQSTFASAVYLSTSMMNHSCDANTYITFLNSYMVVRAARDIKRGREITNSYGVNYRLYTKEERLERLSQYCFECKCVKCKEVNKPEFVHQSRGFICNHCNGPVVRKGFRSTLELTCLGCGSTKFEQLAQVIDNTEDLYEYGVTMLDKNPKKALDYLQECRVRRKDLYPPTSKALAETYAAISLCYAYLDEVEEREKYMQMYTEYIDERYGPVSLDLAYNYERVGEIICQFIEKNENDLGKIKRAEVEHALGLFKHARWVVSVTYGPYEPYRHVTISLDKKITYIQGIIRQIDNRSKAESANDPPIENEEPTEEDREPVPSGSGDTSGGELFPGDRNTSREKSDDADSKGAGGGDLIPTASGVSGGGVLGPADGGNTGGEKSDDADGKGAGGGDLIPTASGGSGGGVLDPADGGNTGGEKLDDVDGVGTVHDIRETLNELVLDEKTAEEGQTTSNKE